LRLRLRSVKINPGLVFGKGARIWGAHLSYRSCPSIVPGTTCPRNNWIVPGTIQLSQIDGYI